MSILATLRKRREKEKRKERMENRRRGTEGYQEIPRGTERRRVRNAQEESGYQSGKENNTRQQNEERQKQNSLATCGCVIRLDECHWQPLQYRETACPPKLLRLPLLHLLVSLVALEHSKQCCSPVACGEPAWCRKGSGKDRVGIGVGVGLEEGGTLGPCSSFTARWERRL